MEQKKNTHKGHRDRFRKKFTNKGNLGSMHDHEFLELLLFYAIPRCNTNEIAHKLINKFRTLQGVFDASIDSLMSVEGVGEAAAVLLSVQSELCKRYYNSKMLPNKTILTSENVSDLLKHLFVDAVNERFYMISLDGKNRIINSDLMCEGSINTLPVYTRKIINRALELNASKVLFAHNHPSGNLIPSDADITTTKMLISALAFVDIAVVDHAIFAEDKYISMRIDSKAFKA